MADLSKGKHALFISDRSGLQFPYTEMVREWNGARVHTSEFEPKQPQLQPKPVGADPQALQNPRPPRPITAGLIMLNTNPFTTVIAGGVTYVNVYSVDHQRKTGDMVRFRGPPVVTSAGAGGPNEADQRNLQAFITIPTFDNVSDLSSATGFSITVGKKNSNGTVTTSPGDLTSPENYFFITSTSNATTGGIAGGGNACSVGPVTLEAV
jgi:hypothetical protein|tara:strand:+ start:1835 stop:2461 length:627 start_codon:yes stop_codon:yes gene_type:complete